jgi:thymidylate synthase (FAD)
VNSPTVELKTYTPEPEKVVCAAAKLCYASAADQIFEVDSRESEVFLRRLRTMGHMSPFEHVNFTFYIQGVSRAMTHQLVRHRLASYSQRSQRYVDHAEFEYVTPPSLEGRTVVDESGVERDAIEFYRECMDRCARAYDVLQTALGGATEAANQDARYVLPNAAETKIVMTVNARELLHFFAERLCRRAQWEIRHVAEKMLEEVRGVAPLLFSGAGPKCVGLGHCPEGKLSCGKYNEMRKRYGG